MIRDNRTLIQFIPLATVRKIAHSKSKSGIVPRVYDNGLKVSPILLPYGLLRTGPYQSLAFQACHLRYNQRGLALACIDLSISNRICVIPVCSITGLLTRNYFSTIHIKSSSGLAAVLEQSNPPSFRCIKARFMTKNNQ
jgi:hypothetical protein